MYVYKDYPESVPDGTRYREEAGKLKERVIECLKVLYPVFEQRVKKELETAHIGNKGMRDLVIRNLFERTLKVSKLLGMENEINALAEQVRPFAEIDGIINDYKLTYAYQKIV